MRSFPLNALKALPLPNAVEKEACLSALRLSNFDKLAPGNSLEVLKNFVDEPFVEIPDRCAVKLVPSHRFRVTIPP